jgi:hypothetical protein
MLIILRSRQAIVCPIWTIAKTRQIAERVGESSTELCDRLSRTRDFSQRQLPTDYDYATSTREYQTDQSSLKPAPTAAGSVLEKRQKQRQRQKQPHRFAGVDRVTPYKFSSGLIAASKGVILKVILFASITLNFGERELTWGPV